MAVVGLRTLSVGKQDPAAILDNHSLSKNLPQWFDKSRLRRGCSTESALTTNGLNPFALSLSKGLDSNIV